MDQIDIQNYINIQFFEYNFMLSEVMQKYSISEISLKARLMLWKNNSESFGSSLFRLSFTKIQLKMSFENPAKPELELHEWSLSDEYSEPSSITSNEFYCLDGGFASHLPTHYKVRMNRTLCKPTNYMCQYHIH